MVRFGVIGTNWITDEFIRGAMETGDFVLNAVYSRTEETARAFAEKYAVSDIFTDLEAMAHSKLIDAVYIASPNSFHAQQASLFLANNKHVLCEKPIASNCRELSKIIEVAKRQQVVLMEGMKTGFLPNFQAVKENLHKIGRVRRFISTKCQYSSRYDAYKRGALPNTFNPDFSNGSLMDIGIYCIYPVVHLFGRPKHIQANAVMLKSGVDGEGSVCLQYDDMEAIIVHSKITDSLLGSEIQGEEGSILIDKISTPENVKIVYRNGATETITREQNKNLMYYEIREFIDLIQKSRGESEINSHQRSLEVLAIMDAARKQFGLIFPADHT